jgi:hypothetical protein
MSIHTSIKFLDGNDKYFLKVKNGTSEQKEEWEWDYGSIENNPGVVIDTDDLDIVEETDEEYGGWLIPIDKIPKNATHIKIERS